MYMVLLVILVLILVGALPGVSGRTWGYAPSGLVGVLLIILLILMLTGRIG